MYISYFSTITIVFKTLNRHPENGPPGTQVESGVMDPASPCGKGAQAPRRCGETAPGPPGCVIMDAFGHYLKITTKEAFMTRTLALVLVLVVLAGSQPAVLLQRLFRTVELLLNILRQL
jgi:hypothetical protein